MRTKRCPQVAWMALLGLAVSGLVWSTPALAQEQRPRRGACAADVQRFCPEARTSQERAQCLKRHEADLSQGCKDLRARATQARSKRMAVREACRADAETWCKDVAPGRGGLMQCLQSHRAELSAACRDALPQGKGR